MELMRLKNVKLTKFKVGQWTCLNVLIMLALLVLVIDSLEIDGPPSEMEMRRIRFGVHKNAVKRVRNMLNFLDSDHYWNMPVNVRENFIDPLNYDEDDNLRFELFSCNVDKNDLKYVWVHQGEAKYINITDVNTYVSKFGNKGINLYTHGWTSKVDARPYIWKLFDTAEHPLIVVDWASYADSLNYWYVADCVNKVAKIITDDLSKISKSIMSRSVMIGHSLGGHVVGIAAKKLKPKLLIGLDEAAPLFSNWRDDDEKFSPINGVKVVSLITSTLGVGHMDADLKYVVNNNSTTQPGCGVVDLTCQHGFSHLALVLLVGNNSILSECLEYDSNDLGPCNKYGPSKFSDVKSIIQDYGVYNAYTDVNKASDLYKLITELSNGATIKVKPIQFMGRF